MFEYFKAKNIAILLNGNFANKIIYFFVDRHIAFCVFSEVLSEVGLIVCLTSIPYSKRVSGRIANSSPRRIPVSKAKVIQVS